MNLKSGLIAARKDGELGWLIFDNPSKLNALSPGMTEDAQRVIEGFEDDASVKVVVMRGSGEKAFISGGDISSFNKTRSNADAAARSRKIQDDLARTMTNMSKPLIAMVHGYCLGGGLGMALNADLRFVSVTAQFSVPAAQRGIAYPPSGLKKLVDLVGPSAAKDIMFSARRFGAQEALNLGLVNRVFDADRLEEETIAYARLVAGNAPLSVRASKFFVEQLGLEPSARDEAKIEQMIRTAADSNDFKEATRSFVEKRKPIFTGT